MIVHHADDGHAEVASDAERDAETETREDGDDVAAWQAEARTVHDGKLLLLHQLRPSVC